MSLHLSIQLMRLMRRVSATGERSEAHFRQLLEDLGARAQRSVANFNSADNPRKVSLERIEMARMLRADAAADYPAARRYNRVNGTVYASGLSGKYVVTPIAPRGGQVSALHHRAPAQQDAHAMLAEVVGMPTMAPLGVMAKAEDIQWDRLPAAIRERLLADPDASFRVSQYFPRRQVPWDTVSTAFSPVERARLGLFLSTVPPGWRHDLYRLVDPPAGRPGQAQLELRGIADSPTPHADALVAGLRGTRFTEDPDLAPIMDAYRHADPAVVKDVLQREGLLETDIRHIMRRLEDNQYFGGIT
ncbi:MAG: hypothetical protein HOQ24_02030 [Mycobacteriaceae bacterium]|nr:hypothetical protein [Mycobacteriaceae bacterium]